ncbi:MAG: hypothetical protein QQN63_11220, partial [Nitrosopumilus sp.]
MTLQDSLQKGKTVKVTIVADDVSTRNINVLSVIPGTGAINLGKEEDTQHSTGDVGVMILGVENQDQAALTSGDKDYTPIAVSREGNVLVRIPDALPTGANTIGVVDLGATDNAILDQIAVAVEKLDDITGALKGPGEPTIDSVTQFAINLNAGANQVLVASALNKQIWVYAVGYTLSVAGTVSFQDEDDVAITGIMDHAA